MILVIVFIMRDLNFFIFFSGAVLFPEATLPLRVIESNFVAAVEKALHQNDAPYTIGVVSKFFLTVGCLLCPYLMPPLLESFNAIWNVQVHVQRDPDSGRIKFSTIGTTAEV